MHVMNLFFIVFIIFALCILGMAVGIIIRNKGFSTCGRAAAAALEGKEGVCSVCGSGSSECKRDSKDKQKQPDA